MLQTLGNRIEEKRRQAKLSQEELGEKLGLSHSSVSNWEKDKSKPNGVNLHKLALILNCSIDWLLNGKNQTHLTQDIDRNQFLQQTPNIAKIPVFSDENIIHHQLKNNNATRYIVTDRCEISKKSFAYVISNNSMFPIFMPDDIVIIDPTVKIETNHFVLAKMANNVLFRKLIIKELNDNIIHFLLAPLSNLYPAIHSDQCSIEILGTLVEHRSYRSS